ncbi:hypothetical protein C8R45DRAFT_1184644 [Mycena sanguinolenta]|nr:hypothetical protein C8R45DRAFT_1184644 [Mycena sanguinolenta]
MSQVISYSQTSEVMLGGVHKPDAANNEARPLERRHAGPRPTSAASSARPRRCRAQSRPLPPPSDASSTRLTHAAPPRRTTARRGLSPRPQRTRCVCLRYIDRNYPLLVTDCVGRRASPFFRSPRLHTSPPPAASPRLSPGRVPVPLELELAHPDPYEREHAPPRTSAYKTSRAAARCVHGQHDVSTTRRRKSTGQTTIWKSQSRLAHALAWHSSRRVGKPPARTMRAPAAVRPEGDLEIANPSPSSRNSARAPERTTHAPACKTLTTWRSRWLIRMASANPIPPGSDGRMRAYHHGHSSIFAPL